MSATNLFGEEITEQEAAEIPSARPKKTGHAAPAGSGPEGEICKTCIHYCRRGGNAKVYLKCGLMRKHWTSGPGTDIKAGDPACRLWESAL